MKLSAAALGLFLFLGSTNAQYFSVGWAPGQKVSSQNTPANSVVPPQASSSSQTAATAATEEAPSIWTANSFIEKLLTFGPAATLLSSLGVNVSAAVNEKLWDERIQLITDENYQNVIVNETLTSREEKERAWVILITGQAVRHDELSKLADNVFDTAYDQTLKAGDLPHIKWGRIDYLNVTRITTKWIVWQVPYIVIITDRGQTLRFYRHYQVRLRAENLRDFLKTKEYLLTPSWSTAYSPGGEREYILDHFATILANLYNITILFPRWILVVASGAIASLLMGLMHRASNKTTTKPTPAAVDEKKPSELAPVPIPAKTIPITQPNGTASSSKPAPFKQAAPDNFKQARERSPPKSASKTLTPAATDSEFESNAKPSKRTSARTKKPKKASS